MTPNGGVRDQNNTSDSLTLDVDEFTEFEFSIVASSTAVEGETYCFRLSRSSQALSTYTNIARVTIAADVLVQGYGTQVATSSVLDTDIYAGGGFRIIENSSSRDVTSITLSEIGSIDGASGIENLKLFMKMIQAHPITVLVKHTQVQKLSLGVLSVVVFQE